MNSISRLSIIIGACCSGIGVALGAFGAHALKERLTEHYLDVFETGVRYQIIHGMALILFGIVAQLKPMPKYIYVLFLVGVCIFCGSLYGISLGSLLEGNPLRWLGAAAPLGGVSLIISWILFAYSAGKK